MNKIRVFLILHWLVLGALAQHGAESANPPSVRTNHLLQFIDTSFENASPVWYDFAADGTVQVYLLYDHERSSPNRAAGHIHFLIHAATGPSSHSNSGTSTTFGMARLAQLRAN